MPNRARIDWIALDWGTSRLRAVALAADGAVIARRESDAGMGRLSPDGFEPALAALIDDWTDGETAPIFAAGMVGARAGWREAPYAAAPCAPLDPALFVAPDSADPSLRPVIVHGVRQNDPPDVMRGEETQIAGFLRETPNFDGVLCLPGTHAKWARISAGEIVAFRTFMTGEIFALLADQSVLRHALDDMLDEAAFADAAEEGLARPEQVAARLFGLRAESLIGAPAPGAARARLSGWLIGMELAAAKGWWLGMEVAVIGAPEIAALYRTALRAEGVTAPVTSAEAASLAGLSQARALWEARR